MQDERAVINEVAELQGCSSALFFEARKRKDLYLWVGATPDGPTVKFEVTNVHTMAELKLAGNHLKGSRPLVQFDAAFDGSPQGRLIRELLTHTFVVPKGCRKAKPFVDHVLAFFWLDGRVWVRNYQAVWPEGADTAQPHQKGAAPPELVEVGPRCVLHPIKVFAGSFRGAVLWGNAGYVSPNAVRRHARARQGGAYQRKVKAKERRKEHTGKWKGKADEFANERMFA